MYILKNFFFALCIILLAAAGTIRPTSAQTESVNPGDFNAVRIEDDLSLNYPDGKSEEILEYLRKTYIDDTSFVQNLGPEFTASYGDEDFTDTYFDTPTLQLKDRKTSLRHRLRVNRLDPENRKNGRQLIQFKLSDDDKLSDEEHDGSRNEIKFDVVEKRNNKTVDDRHPLIGLIVPEQREDFKNRVREILNIDPYDLRPILTLNQQRRRVYILRNGETFVSFSVDDVVSKRWWARVKFSQMELELNELAYTEADAETRDRMREIRKGMVQNLRDWLPFLEGDTQIKYTKTYELLAKKIPFMEFFIKIGLL